MDRQGSEYAWIHSWIMLKYSYTCLKQNLESLYKLLNAHRYTHIMVIDIVLKEIKFIKCIERLHIYSLLLIQIYIGIYRFVMTLLYSISAQKMYLMKQKFYQSERRWIVRIIIHYALCLYFRTNVNNCWVLKL